jgi:hypothetical protein
MFIPLTHTTVWNPLSLLQHNETVRYVKCASDKESKAITVHNTKNYGSCRGITPLFLNLGTRWMTMVKCTFRPLYPYRQNPRYPLNTRQHGPRAGTNVVEGKKSLACARNRTSDVSPLSVVDIPTTLPRLQIAQEVNVLLTAHIVYQYSETNVMHFLFNLFKSSTSVLLQPTDITRTQYTNYRLFSVS